MIALLTLLATSVSAAPPVSGPERPAAAPPNIIVIMSDEHNASVMGCAGNKVARTPHLDVLASRGVIFDAHYCSSPICTPSRQSFTTGKYVSGHRVWSNTRGVPEGTPSLARILNAAGYESFLIGKMHYKGGESHGYQVINEKTGRLQAAKLVPAEVTKPRPRSRLTADLFRDNRDELGDEFKPLGVDEMDAFVDVFRRDAAVNFLHDRKAGGKPFFLTVGLIAPHYPLVAPANLLEHYKDKVAAPSIPAGYLESLPLNYKHLRNDRRFEKVPADTAKLGREAYYARVEWADKQVGFILTALKNSEFADNTIVIYTTDHGENLGEHGLWWKNCLYDCGARVPLIVSWPARWKGGQRRAGACGTVDLVQTIAAVGGARVPTDWKGASMVPWLNDQSHAWRDLAVSEYYAGYIASGIAMIRMGNWKYVYHTRADEKHGPEVELYDLKADPAELRNLAKEPGQAERLTEMHKALVAEVGEDPEKTEARWRAGEGPEQIKKQDEPKEAKPVKPQPKGRALQADQVFNPRQPVRFQDSFQEEPLKLWNYSENDQYRLEAVTPDRIKVTDAPGLGQGRKAVRFAVERSPNSFRSEISLPHEKGFQERWYAGRILIPEDWVFDESRGEDIVLQWHALPGDFRPTFPNLAISVRNDRWFVRQSHGDPKTQPTRSTTKLDDPVKRGVWVSWVIHAKWSPKEDGLLRIWRDSKLVVDRKGPNVYGTIGVEYTPYLKTGIYHPAWHLQTDEQRAAFEKAKPAATKKVVYVTDIKVGNERAKYDDVAPAALK
ncbi:MAG: hypothetical protein C0467_30960 [Planctomycetaceae bacterium]|nr:hypothetical protein [Planctomycetaceae bacterium]